MKLIYILVLVFCVMATALISAYNRFDKLSFTVDRLWHAYRAELLRWAELTGEMAAAGRCEEAANMAAEYPRLRNVRKKAELVSRLIAATPAEGCDPRLLADRRELEASLADFSARYRELTEDFNRKLEKSNLTQTMALVGIKPFPELDFGGGETEGERADG